MAYFIENGYTPEAVLNYLCLLGWSPKDNREMLPLEEIRDLFQLESINRRNAIFDLDKCFWLNGQYILQMSLERFCELSLPVRGKSGDHVRIARDAAPCVGHRQTQGQTP